MSFNFSKRTPEAEDKVFSILRDDIQPRVKHLCECQGQQVEGGCFLAWLPIAPPEKGNKIVL